MFGLLMMRNLLILPVIILIAGCNLDVCNNLISSELNSPTNAYIATTFTRGCGGTTPTLAIVSIRKKMLNLMLIITITGCFQLNLTKKRKLIG